MKRKFTPKITVSFLVLVLLNFPLPGGESADGVEEWARAIQGRMWGFPRDHGSHPEFKTEWWYFTGHLADESGSPYGYQLTFFRAGIRRRPADPSNTWSVGDLYFAHLAVTDGAAGRFRYAERASRTGPGLAGASPERLQLWTLSWSARMEEGLIFLSARDREVEIDLTLRPLKPVVRHGENGLSRKGPAPGQASYYSSLTNLETKGFLRSRPEGPRLAVAGRSWFDHEFGSNQLAPDQEGWDWFGLHLSDGRDLMIYMLRKKDGRIEPASSGTLVEPDGQEEHLALIDFTVSKLAEWASPQSSGKYPSRWRIRVPSRGIDLTLSPLLADQELRTASSTGVTYWEGAVAGRGTSAGRDISCRGYVEMTGYAGSLGGLF
ncbi:MAG: carotenoid 1,2-hydratase [Deltaproteobacteria bacterium]|nr:carotenoid 1,2-hydratase [Deltaproteobacteria bacterium]